LGIFTNVGVAKSIEAQNNQGFKILPTSFAVSDLKTTPLLPSQTTQNSGTWYAGPIASRVVVNDHTIKFVCTIPPGVIPANNTRVVREIYINGIDTNSVPFLFCVGQTSTDVLYDPSGTVTLELEISLTNADLSSQIVFAYTQATELLDHNTDPGAHPDILQAINKAGIFLKAGAVPFAYAGQNFDEKANFAGTAAQGTCASVTYLADFNGPAGNGIGLVFDGIKTVNQTVTTWNNANPSNTISFAPGAAGNNVPAAGNLTLAGGTLLVSQGDLVYRDVDGFYKKGLADGSIKQRVVGTADITARVVRGGGFQGISTGFPIGTELYLHDTIAGAFKSSPTAVKVGVVMSTTSIYLASFGGGSGGLSQQFDAVVSDSPGFRFFPTTQQAVTATPDGGKILVDKFEDVATTIATQSKELTFVFNGPQRGWRRDSGATAEHKLTFSQVPTSGTFRIEWNGYESSDLPYNAPNSSIEAFFNSLIAPVIPGFTGVVVSGNYTTGILINFQDNNNYPLPTFTFAGRNKIQRLNLSAVPDNGTFKFQFNAQETAFVAYNDDNIQVENYLEALSAIQDIDLTGGFGSSYFQIEFVNADGRQPQNDITTTSNTLERLGVPVTFSSVVIQTGKFPASNLKAGLVPVVITATTTQAGAPVGPGTCVQVTKDGTRFLGNGTVEGFDVGIDLNSSVDVDIELNFFQTTLPVLATGLSPNKDFHTQKSFGMPVQVIRTVGQYGQYLTIDDAYSAANPGDLIQVLEDQSISTPKVWTKEIEIEFLNNAKLIPGILLASPVVTLGNKIRTRNLWLSLLVSGTWTTAFSFQGNRGHHSNLQLELSGSGVFVTNAFVVESGASQIYCEGALLIGTATLTNYIVNNSGVVSHNFQIRDKDNGTYLDLLNRGAPVQEQPTGVVNGINNLFTLSTSPQSASAIVVFVDGISRVRGAHWQFLSPNQISFYPSFIPQPGQDVYVYYPVTSLYAPSANGRATPLDVTDENILIESSVNRLEFGSNLVATQLSPGVVKIDSTGGGPGGDLQNISVDPTPDTDANHSLGTSVKRWKDLFLRDKTTGDTYRLEVDNGVLQAVLVP
jgi:hypothetical protein